MRDPFVIGTDIRPEVHAKIDEAYRRALDAAIDEGASYPLTAVDCERIRAKAAAFLRVPIDQITVDTSLRPPRFRFTGSCVALARRRGWRHE
jgi:hypothetical protein